MKLKIRALLPHHTQRGQSLVELAISLTVMLLLLAGAVTFGMALFSYVALRDAAQEGALYGSFNPQLVSDPTQVNVLGVRQRVHAASTSPIDLSALPDANITVATTPAGAPPCEGTTSGAPNGIQVTVSYQYQIIMPYIGGILGQQTIPLTAQVTDTILEPKCP